MLTRGFLKSPGHNYILDSEIISVGKGSDNSLAPPPKFKIAGAHIPISLGKADPYHAIVEKKPEENCFYLTDLNTAYGTFVNEKRIQNNKIKLSPGDRIRFGHGGLVHEFGIYEENPNRINRQSKENRVEKGSIEDLHRPVSAQNNTLHILSNIVRPDTAPHVQPEYKNANFLKVLFSERAKSVPVHVKMNAGIKSESEVNFETESNPVPAERQTFVTTPSATHDEWSLDGHDISDGSDRETMTISKASSVVKETLPSEPWYITMLHEKEQRLLHMGDELNRLALAEDESKKKDEVILELRHKIAQMEMKTALYKQKLSNNATAAEKNIEILQTGDEITRLMVYQQECERKGHLIGSLQEQVGQLELERQRLAKNFDFSDQNRIETPISQDTLDEWKSSVDDERNLPPSNFVEQIEENLTNVDISLQQSRDELDEFRKQLNIPIPDRRNPQEVVVELVAELELKHDLITQLTNELKDAKHERNLSDGLAHSLQRDVVRGQHTISKLTTALEKAQKETQEAVAKAKAMSNKFSNLKEEIKHEEILATMEKNFCDTQERLKDFQQQLSKQQQKYDKQSKELRKANRQTKQHVEKGRVLETQVEELQAEILELRQQEQNSRVLNEHTTARLERLRSKVIQAVYTSPGAIKPESKLNDSDILSAIQKLINDRSDFHQQLCDMGQQMPPLITALDTQSEDSSDVEVAVPANTNAVEKKPTKGPKKTLKK